MALVIFISVFILVLALVAHGRKKISAKEAEQIDELVTIIIPTINSKK